MATKSLNFHNFCFNATLYNNKEKRVELSTDLKKEFDNMNHSHFMASRIMHYLGLEVTFIIDTKKLNIAKMSSLKIN